uniref:Cobalamin-binding protein n=1 Tax=Candidatus Methanomethylicus mesodigestus TaxID=1867258 RepID=A0A7C3J1T0_9CREN
MKCPDRGELEISEKNKLLEDLSKAVQAGDEEATTKLAKQAIELGIDPIEAIDNGLAIGMKIIGDKFSKQEIFLPEVMLAADAMKAAINILRPHIKGEISKKGKVVIGTMLGDIHDIGKNLVATMLEVNGFEVIDLGNDVPVQRFIEEAQKNNVDIIALSSLITASMFYMEDVVKNLEGLRLRDRFRVLIGGGPTTPTYAEEIGVDGWGRHAEEGVQVANQLVSEKRDRRLTKPIILGEVE